MGNGSLTNTGTIIGGNGSGGDGIFVASTGPVDNTGGVVIGGDGGAGIYLALNGALAINGMVSGGVAGVMLKQGGVLTNIGSIAGPQGVFIETGGSVTNEAGAVITGGAIAAVFVTGGSGGVINSGTLLGAQYGVEEKAGGSVTNNASAVISASTNFGIYISGTLGTVVNLGSLISGGVGVYEHDGGSVTNEAGGVLSASANGIVIAGGSGTVVNSNTLQAEQSGVIEKAGGSVTNNASAVITANSGNGVYLATGTVVNLGAIIATGDNDVVFHSSGGVLVNSGVISSTLADGLYVYAGGGANVTNIADGTISGVTGLYLGYGTVVDAGTIIATGSNAYAVTFSSGSPTTSRLIVDPGAVFNGNIAGGTGVIELASAASAGALSGFGAGITNFSSLVFDPGARWTIYGDDSAAGFGTIAIGGFAVGDTIDLTNFVATSKTFASNTLVLSDGSLDHATLAIQGDFTTSDFTIVGDGNAGTDIFLRPPGPAISGAAGGQAMTDATTLHPFSAVSIADTDEGQVETVIVTLSNAANGTLTNLAGGTFNNGTYVVAGDAKTVTDALNGLVFDPTVHQVALGGHGRHDLHDRGDQHQRRGGNR